MTRRHAVVMAALAGGAVGLWALGDGVLAPPGTDPGTWSGWLQDRGPGVASMAVLRLVALAVHAYLALAVAASAVDHGAGRPSGGPLPLPAGLRAALSPRVLVPKVLAPGVLAPGMGVTLALGAVAPSAPDATDPSRPGTAVMEPIDADATGPAMPPEGAPGTTSTTSTATDRHPGRAPTPTIVGPAVDPTAGADGRATHDPLHPVPRATVPPAPPAATAGEEPSRVVQAGDSLWRLAEDELGDRLGRAPTERETAGYWRSVVAANRDRIRSGDPDVLHPGETVILPR